MSREATIEQSSIREAAGYDQVFQIGHEPEEGISWLLKRETSTLSPDEEVESCVVKGGEEEEINEGEDEGDEKRMTETRVTLTREPSKVEVQKALGMGIPIHLSFLNVDRQ